MQVIPLNAVPSQTVAVLLGTQSCALNVYQKSTGLFIDVLLSGTQVIGGVICLDANLIVRSSYFGFAGDLAFYDTTLQGEDPYYTGLGSQFVLMWLEPSDLA
jgi:hypothetical protein